MRWGIGRCDSAGQTTKMPRGMRPQALGHKNGSITSRYSAAELDQLIEALHKVTATDSRGPALTTLQKEGMKNASHAKVTRMKKANGANIGLSH